MQEFPDFKSLFTKIQSHPQYSNQIKLKRLKKQFQMLQNYQNEQTSIQKIYLSSIGIQLSITNRKQNNFYQYKMILGFQYPFNRPHVNYIKKGHQMARCKDLLDNLIDGNKWGPSLMITSFLNKIHQLTYLIRQGNYQNIKWTYNCSYELYRKDYLKQMGIQLYNVEEYTWKYLIKSTAKKILGLTDDSFLLFEQTKTQGNLNLSFYKSIDSLTTAKASVKGKKFTLQISYPSGQNQSKLYFGGSSNIQQILSFLNPIQMLQRSIQKFQKHYNNKNIKQQQLQQKGQQIIKQYTELIEYYSLKNQNRAETYMNKMKEVIKKICYHEIKLQQVEENNNNQIVGKQNQLEEIQT